MVVLVDGHDIEHRAPKALLQRWITKLEFQDRPEKLLVGELTRDIVVYVMQSAETVKVETSVSHTIEAFHHQVSAPPLFHQCRFWHLHSRTPSHHVTPLSTPIKRLSRQ